MLPGTYVRTYAVAPCDKEILELFFEPKNQHSVVSGILASWHPGIYIPGWYAGILATRSTPSTWYILPGVSFPDRSSKQEPHKLDLQYYSLFPIYVDYLLFFLAFFFNPSYCTCLLYTSPSPRDLSTSRMPSSA